MGYTTAIRIVRTLEGGKVDDPDDPGGRTNCGVTQDTYNSAGYMGDVWRATDEQIASIYYTFWTRVKVNDPLNGVRRSLFDILAEPADSMAFQMYVNMPGHFAEAMQHAAGVKEDGIIGPVTMHALDRTHTGTELSYAIADAQRRYYLTIRQQDKFTVGLVNRVDRALKLLDL